MYHSLWAENIEQRKKLDTFHMERANYDVESFIVFKCPSRKSWKSHWIKVKLARVLAGTIGSVCISVCHFILLYCVVNFSNESSHGKEYFLKKHKRVFAKYIHIDSDWNRDRNWSYFGKNHYYSCLNQNLKRKKIGF